jgi:diguanylate cyclase (GGDEF)-like protein/PAS domain S-box-containing protein
MTDPSKTNRELIKENALLKQRIQELEQAESGQKPAEKALHESEEKYRLIVENANEALYVLQGGIFRYANRMCGEMLGVPVAELIGVSMLEFLNPDDRKKAISQHLRILSGELTAGRSDFRVLTRYGEERWADVNSVKIEWNGKTATLNFATDITDRRQAEEALRESDEKYRSLASAADSMYLVDRNCRFLLVNERHLARFGLPAEQVIGRTHDQFHSAENAVIFKNYVTTVFETGESLQDEYRSARDGRYFVRTLSPVKGDNGMTSSVTVVAKDITERKRMEEELKKREALLNEMGRMAKVGGWELDAESQKLVWTKEVYHIHEVDESCELTLGKAIGFYLPASRPVIERAVQRTMECGEPFDVELEIITAKGNHRWVHANGKVDRERGITKTISGTFQDITERRQAEEKIRQMAYHDSLTGLPNRKLFSDRLNIALAQARRNQKKVGIAMLDLDNFKGVNDTLGHDVGDLLLKATAERLSAALRKSDTVARCGGDEFVLILPALEVIEDAIQVAQKIVDSFRKPLLIDTHQLVVTTSIGIAFYPDDGADEGMLLKNADIAMYQAKQAGRNRYRLHSEA